MALVTGADVPSNSNTREDARRRRRHRNKPIPSTLTTTTNITSTRFSTAISFGNGDDEFLVATAGNDSPVDAAATDPDLLKQRPPTTTTVQHVRRKKNYKKRYRRNESFGCLVLRVATALAFLCLVVWKMMTYLGISQQPHRNQSDNDDQQQDDFVYDAAAAVVPPKVALHPNPVVVPRTEHPRNMDVDVRATEPPLPLWNLTQRSTFFDAYAIASQKNALVQNVIQSQKEPPRIDLLFLQAAAGLRERFAEYYANGSIQTARGILQRSMTNIIPRWEKVEKDDFDEALPASSHSTATARESVTTLPSDLQHTTCRILNAHRDHRPFRFAFGGYSVTAGRGNYFQQSFPFVMKQQLQTLFQLLGIELEVRNAAIGGCPSFPYGWCMTNFWGNSPDVVSWDYSMNEAGGDPMGMEAYLRHVMVLPSRPKLIILDSYSMGTDRRKLLHSYAAYARRWYSGTVSSAHDPVVIHTDRVVPSFLEIQPEDRRPTGFRDWRTFGAPLSAPGQSRHHPAVKEHEFMAWLISMHFLSALELAAMVLQDEVDESTQQLRDQCDRIYQSFHDDMSTAVSLPQPVTNATVQSTLWKSLLWGEKSSSPENGPKWTMNPIHCRTSFEPIVLGNLSDVVVSGSVGEDLDVLLPKSKMFYNQGWVLDLSDEEKKAKRNLARFGGLGFIDSKRAYYGIYTSGTLRMFLPHDSSRSENSNRRPRVGDKALDWIKSITVCEVNAKKFGGSSCDIARDVHFTVGGVNATLESTIDANGAMYLGKKLCTYVSVPEKALLTSRAEIIQKDSKRIVASHPIGHPEDDLVGLEVTITIHNHHIVKRDDSCSVSHVIWEQKTLQSFTDVGTKK
jgi:hypothetical protein